MLNTLNRLEKKLSEVNVPKLNRKPRESESRNASAQRKPWTPPSRLDAPPAPEGINTVGLEQNQQDKKTVLMFQENFVKVTNLFVPMSILIIP